MSFSLSSVTFGGEPDGGPRLVGGFPGLGAGGPAGVMRADISSIICSSDFFFLCPGGAGPPKMLILGSSVELPGIDPGGGWSPDCLGGGAMVLLAALLILLASGGG